jgi:hypothetical protein
LHKPRQFVRRQNFRLGRKPISDGICVYDLDGTALDGSGGESVGCKAHNRRHGHVEAELSDAKTMRRRLSSDGTTLSVKYRKSAAFVGFGGYGEDKQLTVRIPRYMLTQLGTLQITGSRANVSLCGVGAKELRVVTKRGDIDIDRATFDTLTLKAERGNATVWFDDSDGFVLELDADKNRFVCDRTLEETEEGYRYGDGRAKIAVSAPLGKVEFKAKASE